MARIDPKINKERGKRVKELLESENKTQVWLAEQLYLQPEHLNMMLNGKRNLGEDKIQAIARLFPDVKLDWLLGISDYRTDWEHFSDALSQCEREGDLLMIGFKAFAQLSGYSITFTSPPTLHGEKRTAPVEEWLKMVKDGYTISNGEKAAIISIEDMNHLQNEICDFVEFKLDRLCKNEVSNG